MLFGCPFFIDIVLNFAIIKLYAGNDSGGFLKKVTEVSEVTKVSEVALRRARFENI